MDNAAAAANFLQSPLHWFLEEEGTLSQMRWNGSDTTYYNPHPLQLINFYSFKREFFLKQMVIFKVLLFLYFKSLYLALK